MPVFYSCRSQAVTLSKKTPLVFVVLSSKPSVSSPVFTEEAGFAARLNPSLENASNSDPVSLVFVIAACKHAKSERDVHFHSFTFSIGEGVWGNVHEYRGLICIAFLGKVQ